MTAAEFAMDAAKECDMLRKELETAGQLHDRFAPVIEHAISRALSENRSHESRSLAEAEKWLKINADDLNRKEYRIAELNGQIEVLQTEITRLKESFRMSDDARREFLAQMDARDSKIAASSQTIEAYERAFAEIQNILQSPDNVIEAVRQLRDQARRPRLPPPPQPAPFVIPQYPFSFRCTLGSHTYQRRQMDHGCGWFSMVDVCIRCGRETHLPLAEAFGQGGGK